MDNSFNTWRNSQRESSPDYKSDDDSDNANRCNNGEDVVISDSDSDDFILSNDDEPEKSPISSAKEDTTSPNSNLDAEIGLFEKDKPNFTKKGFNKEIKIPTIDHTSMKSDSASNRQPEAKNSSSHFENINITPNDKVPIPNDDGSDSSDSDSEEDKSKHKCNIQGGASNVQADLGENVSSIQISPDEQKPNLNLPTSYPSNNDLSSRMEGLKAEETRLGVEVSQVLRYIEATKDTLKTSNLSALPDKGVRHQILLKKHESKLRDLRYQQGTLSNEILKLEFTQQHANKPTQYQHQQKQLPKQQVFKLPTTNTDLNALGKKAMETHRAQQALTVDALRALHNSLKNCPTEETVVSDPKGLLVELMPHQKHALAWLMWRESEKPSGGILADDMGLGKTLTMISLVLKSNEERENKTDEDGDDSDDEESSTSSSSRPKLVDGKTLVVCPASLLGQWEGEVTNKIKKYLLEVVIHHGSNREQRSRRLAVPDIVITTYNIISRDANKEQSPLFNIRWQRVILDEAHQVRNFKTQTALAVCKLKAKSRWALTGTPIHNKEIDLFALLKFLRCRPFDDLAVWKRWVDNRDAAGMQRLNTITKSIMLRRTKKGLQEKGELQALTEKSFYNIFITLDKEEKEAYEKLLIFSKTLFAQFLHQKAQKEDALNGVSSSKQLNKAENPFEKHPELARLLSKMNQITDVKSHTILVLILRLRQFCCHPALIKKMLEKEDVANVGIEDNDGLDLDLMDKITRMSLAPKKEDESEQDDESEMSDLSLHNPLFSNDRLSSKMRKVVETLEEILKGEDKVIVVSQWVSLLDLVRMVLRERNIKCAVLTGKVPIPDRAEVVEKFNRKNHNPRVMLLSLTAGGVGLNLVGGNHLLLLDLHWNPQLESQACDRIYRVGQEKQVHIYKFISSETIEERILKLQTDKLEIANSVLTGTKHSNKLTMDDLKTLFQIS